MSKSRKGFFASVFGKKNAPSQIKSSVFRKSDVSKMLSDKSPFGVKESYGAIRTQLNFSRKNEKCPVFAVTSMTPGDGKTVNCINIAISFAKLNKRVLIIDSDMRNPTVHKFFSLSSSNGLSELLAGFATSVNFKTTGVDNLTVLTSGATPPNPAELLNSEQMDKLLKLVREHFDYVFIDTPPVSLVTDATVLAQKVTGYVIVVRPGHSDIRDLKHGVDSLQALGATISGFVCNDADDNVRHSRRAYYKSYYYKRYGYSYEQYAGASGADQDTQDDN